ncbi:MAG: hypothetical protein ACI9W4_001862 [Rhodothermales bacterium]|jgi:uncharacterized protein (TIGR02453 family)
MIDPATISYLTELTANNDRDWFKAHRDRYEAALANAKAFAERVVFEMKQGDDIEDYRMYRIYRDVRFSKDKTPYNPRFGFSLKRLKPRLRGGYFVDLEPTQTRVVVGFWAPNGDDMALIRSHIESDGDRLREVVESPQINSVFGSLVGNGLKTAPRGFTQDHPDIDLLRMKQFLFKTAFSVEETLSPDFVDEVVFTLRAVRPFFDHMSEVLGHDVNGVSLY